MSKKLSGSCLCGAVTYRSAAAPMMAGHCYCADCRKASGTGHSTHVAMPEQGLELKGVLKFYDRPADSGNLVSRGFCPECGSAVLSRNSAMPGVVFLRASSLDDPNAVAPQMIVYASRAPSWDKLDAGLPAFPEMPPAAPPTGRRPRQA